MLLFCVLLLSMISIGNGKVVMLDPAVKIFNSADKCTSEIDINPFIEYQTTSLNVSNGQLTAVPKNINSLKLLQKLHLPYNQIESLEMDSFNNMEHLTDLVLYHNNIKQVTSSAPINLPKIWLIHLQGNQITDLDVCRWNMPVLTVLYISLNKLSYVTNFPNQFPLLKYTALKGNSFNCAWQVQVLRDIGKRNITISGGFEPSPCNKNFTFTPPLECPTDLLIEDEHDKLLVKMEVALKATVESSNQRFLHIEDEIRNCSARLAQSESSMEQFKEKLKFIEQKQNTCGAESCEISINNLKATVVKQQQQIKALVEAISRYHTP